MYFISRMKRHKNTFKKVLVIFAHINSGIVLCTVLSCGFLLFFSRPIFASPTLSIGIVRCLICFALFMRCLHVLLKHYLLLSLFSYSSISVLNNRNVINHRYHFLPPSLPFHSRLALYHKFSRFLYFILFFIHLLLFSAGHLPYGVKGITSSKHPAVVAKSK